MLNRLTVSNYAVVEKAEAEFAPGLNVLTGETGAGKSVLMGALALALGGRADSGIVRDGAKEARVEAAFAVRGAAIPAILEEAGLPPCEGDELLVRRTVGAGGAGRAWVNDASTTVATLRRLGRELADIHGPRANQQVLEESFQRKALDAYGAVKTADYAAAWNAWREAVARLDALSVGGSADEADLLRYQVNELEAAQLTVDDETLAERHAAAAHAEEIVDAANEITEALGGDQGATAALGAARTRMLGLAKHFPSASDWAGEVDELVSRAEELSRTVADAAIDANVGEEDFESLDRRLTLVNRLVRKYAPGAGEGTPVARLMAALEAKRAKLDDWENRETKLAELAKEVAAAEKTLKAEGEKLSKGRAKAAARLGKAVTEQLRDLRFLQAKFAVRLEPCEPESHGMDRVTYLFEPNPGEAARPLADVASSGETARVMLALKVALAEHDPVGLLVFDEVDANIGGETGAVVGRKLRAVSAGRQVIVITHLPQSAAFADRHLTVAKSVSGGRTRTTVLEVTGEGRVAEIARMLGGEKSTGAARKHAEEIIRLSR